MAYLQILAAYAAGVALNGFLPANLGTAVSLLMFVAIIPGANLPGVLGGMVVQKIFFSLAGAFVYAYLLLSVPNASGWVKALWTIALIFVPSPVYPAR